MRTKKLPCPFCGAGHNDTVYIRDNYFNWVKGVHCKKCNTSVYFFAKKTNANISCGLESKEAKGVICSAWNKRTIKINLK